MLDPYFVYSWQEEEEHCYDSRSSSLQYKAIPTKLQLDH